MRKLKSYNSKSVPYLHTIHKASTTHYPLSIPQQAAPSTHTPKSMITHTTCRDNIKVVITFSAEAMHDVEIE
jgi:hypothetical protein